MFPSLEVAPWRLAADISPSLPQKANFGGWEAKVGLGTDETGAPSGFRVPPAISSGVGGGGLSPRAEGERGKLDKVFPSSVVWGGIDGRKKKGRIAASEGKQKQSRNLNVKFGLSFHLA